MDSETYEETRLKRDESWAKYLKEGSTIALVVWNDKVSAFPPKSPLAVFQLDNIKQSVMQSTHLQVYMSCSTLVQTVAQT